MAERVTDAARDLPVYVATDDDDVALWARSRSHKVVGTSGLDLNGSVIAAIAVARGDGIDRVIVAHGDLPFAERLDDLAYFAGITLVPDRRDDGTNVLSIPADLDFVPRYGPGSFVRHLTQARALGLAVCIARRDDLRWDVDTPDDVPATSVTMSA